MPNSEIVANDTRPPMVGWAQHQVTIGERRLEVDVRLVAPESPNLAAIMGALQAARGRQAELIVVGASVRWHEKLERLGFETLGLRWIPPPMPTPRPVSQPDRYELPHAAPRSIVPA